jgi:hypothetical protein
VTVQEIPAGRWHETLEQFSRAHRGQAARVETAGATAALAPDAEGLPLIGLAEDRSGGADESIRIMLGVPSGGHVSHAVRQPRHVRVAEWNDGYSGLLEIEAADGSRTSVQVGPAEQTLPPGMITDGLLR